MFLTCSHRHQDDHKCEKLEVQKPRMTATKELVQKIVGKLQRSRVTDKLAVDRFSSDIPLLSTWDQYYTECFHYLCTFVCIIQLTYIWLCLYHPLVITQSQRMDPKVKDAEEQRTVRLQPK